VLVEMDRREPESAAWIHPQRQHADIVVRFAPIAGRDDPPGTPLSAELMLRPSIRHPDLTAASGRTMHLKLTRDGDGRPVDTLHVHGYVPREESVALEKAIWHSIGEPGGAAPDCLGRLGPDTRSEPLAITQMILLHHLLEAAR
jgi:phosphoribulokinase